MELQGMAPEVAKKFKYWQTRTIIASMIGYALFYFVRKNLSIAMPAMQDDLGITKGDLGLFLTLHGLLYGVSKFANGFVGDRVNARYFMVTGLVLSAACNIWFGFSSAVVMFGIVWMLNGWFQGMGFPPCARLLTHWIPPTQLATTFCWRRFSGDCLWIYCQSRMALVLLVSFYYSLGGCSRFVVCFARYASLGRSSGAQLKNGRRRKRRYFCRI